MSINSQPLKEGLIERMIEFSARHRLMVIMFVAFAVVAAVYSIKNLALDAIPDLSDTQVVIYSKWDRSPDIIEDQVTYPIVTALLGAPNVKAIRGFSDFGFSYVYVIFKDGTDIYWARSRVLEYLSKVSARLPDGVKTELGPDATGVGWVFQYALVDKTGKHNLAELRSYQDWNLRYHLQSVPGVAEVASIGGFVKQYQVTVNPQKLLAYDIPVTKVVEAVRSGNQEAGGRLLEFSGAEYMVRGRGYIKSADDIGKIVLGLDKTNTPILIKNVADVAIGPDIRRGVADLDGEGDVVGGTVIMRFGENALHVIDRVKARLEELKGSLPPGVEIQVVYDRSDLILKAMDTLKHQLLEEMVIVSLVILFFLWHFPSAIIPIITIPIAVLLAFIPMQKMGLTSNIMSLAGIAISIGVLVDGAIVQMENVYKRLEEWVHGGRKGDHQEVIIKALKEVGPSVFFSLLVIAVSFLPIFTLIDQEGRLFKPLAWTKTFAMAVAALLVITLSPALRMMFSRMEPIRWPWQKKGQSSRVLTGLFVGSYHPEEDHPVSRRLFAVYEPLCRWFLKHHRKAVWGMVVLCAWAMLNLAAIFMQVKIPGTLVRGFEFMPTLWEGSILYMPTTPPGISVGEAQRLLQKQDAILKSFPQVDRVFGKAGRIESSTDPAPFSMMETVVLLKPEDQWPKRISHEELISQMDEALQIPGTTNAWTMPIKNRIDMLSTGVRTPLGIKVLGDDYKTIEEIGIEIEKIVRNIPGTRSVYAERTAGGYFIDFDLNRESLARYGLSVADAQMVVLSAVGGEEVTTTVEGRERYSVNVRYPRELRDDVEKLKRVLVPTPMGKQIPLGQIADIQMRTGPSMLRNENGLLAGYVYVDIAGRDLGTYVNEAKKAVADGLQLPQGYALTWSGQYENILRVQERLKVILPLTMFIICLLLYFNTKSMVKTGIVLLAVPFSVIGAVLLMWVLNYNISIAVWVGMIALMGLDAETGVLMLLFLDISYKDAKARGQLSTQNDLIEAIVHGAVKRVRPKMMTVMAAMVGLLPIMWSMGTGADVMKRIAAPMVGGLATSFVLELLLYPVIYFIWKWYFEMNQGKVKSI